MHLRLRPETALAPTLALLIGSCAGSVDIAGFERTLGANDSATVVLGKWCAARNIAEPPTIRALADRTARLSAPPEVRNALNVGNSEALAYRHVRLTCGDTVLSIAHNWYVPARLTPAMNTTLESTEIPFGKVVAPLSFRRERLAEKHGRMAECPAGTILSHRAVLRVADGSAISVVVECYTRANLNRATD